MTADDPFVDLPDRPVPLSTEPTDPCTLVPDGTKSALEIDRPPIREDFGPGGSFTGTFCSWSVSEWGVYGLVLSNDFTAQEYYDTARGEVEQTEVEGYGAVRNYDSDFLESCCLATDSSDEGMVLVAVNDRRGASIAGLEQMCDRAEEFTSVVLTALQAQQ